MKKLLSIIICLFAIFNSSVFAIENLSSSSPTPYALVCPMQNNTSSNKAIQVSLNGSQSGCISTSGPSELWYKFQSNNSYELNHIFFLTGGNAKVYLYDSNNNLLTSKVNPTSLSPIQKTLNIGD